jgi:hypothetical protein
MAVRSGQRTRCILPTRTLLSLVGVLAILVGAAPAVGEPGAVPLRGALIGTAGTLGRVTLSHNGKHVVSLKSGRYKITIADTTDGSGFVMERPNGTEIVVTSVPFVGKRTKTLALTPGRWSFHGAVGALHQFTVVR